MIYREDFRFSFFFAEAHRQVAVSYRDESVDQSFVVVVVQCRCYR